MWHSHWMPPTQKPALSKPMICNTDESNASVTFWADHLRMALILCRFLMKLNEMNNALKAILSVTSSDLRWISKLPGTGYKMDVWCMYVWSEPHGISLHNQVVNQKPVSGTSFVPAESYPLNTYFINDSRSWVGGGMDREKAFKW